MSAKLLIAVVFSVALAGMASEVRLAWDASPTVGVTNYVLYAGTNSLSATNLASANVRVGVGTNLTATVEGLKPGRWYFTATAMMDGMESDCCDAVTTECPVPPANMRTIVVQYSGTLTNFHDVGFFRLRLP